MIKSLLPRWLRGPIWITVVFEDRPYELGERISIDVELSSRKEIGVAEGRVSLVCEESWADTWVKHESMGRFGGMVKRGGEMQGPPVPQRVVKKFIESFDHSEASFAKGITVRPNTPERHGVSLEIDAEAPPHAGGGTLAWTLVTTVETSGGRRVTDTRAVTVTVP